MVDWEKTNLRSQKVEFWRWSRDGLLTYLLIRNQSRFCQEIKAGLIDKFS